MCDKKKQSQAKKESPLFYLVWIKKLKVRTTICSINKLLTLQEKLGLMVLGVRFRNLEIGVRIEELESDFLGLVTLHLCNQSTLRYLSIIMKCKWTIGKLIKFYKKKFITFRINLRFVVIFTNSQKLFLLIIRA